MKRKVKRKFINLLIIYLLILTPKFIINSYSKYGSIIEKKSNIGIAKWDMTINFSNDEINLVSGNNTNDYTLSINSLSEVGYKYYIILSNVPDTIIVEFNNLEYTPNNHQIILESNNIGVGINKQDILLKFKSLIDTPDISNLKIKIDVILKQM